MANESTRDELVENIKAAFGWAVFGLAVARILEKAIRDNPINVQPFVNITSDVVDAAKEHGISLEKQA